MNMSKIITYKDVIAEVGNKSLSFSMYYDGIITYKTKVMGCKVSVKVPTGGAGFDPKEKLNRLLMMGGEMFVAVYENNKFVKWDKLEPGE